MWRRKEAGKLILTELSLANGPFIGQVNSTRYANLFSFWVSQ